MSLDNLLRVNLPNGAGGGFHRVREVASMERLRAKAPTRKVTELATVS